MRRWRSRSSAGCQGFTLMEMLIVFAVFALMGVMASQIVSRVLDNHEILSARGDRLADVQRAMQIIQRDVLQLNPRGIRDQLGDPVQPASSAPTASWSSPARGGATLWACHAPSCSEWRTLPRTVR